MPGEVIESPKAVANGDTLFCKFDAYRLAYKDYTFQARSRKLNICPLVVSILTIIAAIGSYVYEVR